MTSLKKPISRRTNGALGPDFGADRAKRIVCTLVPGNGRDVPDVLELRPERSSRVERITLIHAYRVALYNRVNGERLEKARATKAKKAVRRSRARLDGAERRFRDGLRKEKP